MGKYIHLFENDNHFRQEYYDTSTVEVTSITTEDGTFNYAEEILYETGGRLMYVHVWKKGDTTADWRITNIELRNPEVGDQVRNFSGYSTQKTITARTTVPKEPYYREPWISLTGQYNSEYCSIVFDKPIWLNLYLISYPTAQDTLIDLDNEGITQPSSFPNVAVFVKEPNGIVYEYWPASVYESSASYYRQLSSEERLYIADFDCLYIYKDFINDTWSWSLESDAQLL